ncbi:MAG: ArsA family ATPase [Chloroflexi bacterium]|nr:ArsA family ATPase [Chloroflexota bacterium]
MRVLLFTGKGGVGKTSVATATALRSAELGHRTIVISTDSAHSLGDSLDVAVTEHAQQVAPNLWAQETNLSKTIESHWGAIRDWVVALMRWRGMDELTADEMAILPGMEELANLLYIVSFYESGQYDTIVIDCAPTGETLRLLSFPEVLRWWMEKLFPIERRAVGILRPLIAPIIHAPILPTNEVLDAMEHLFRELLKMRKILVNPDETSVRLVVNPEKMVLKEAQRTFTYLNLYGYFTDLVVCNRIIPPEVSDGYFAMWKDIQERNYSLIEEAFSPVPIKNVPLFDREVTGLDMLRNMAQAVYKDEDPNQLYFHGRAHDISKENGHYTLTLDLPLATKEQISLLQSGDELIVQVGDFRRNIILPHVLIGLPVEEAKFDHSQLKIRFGLSKKRTATSKE